MEMKITTGQIRKLRSEAIKTGNRLQVSICDVALTRGLDTVAEYPDDLRSDLVALGIIPEHIGADMEAREVCDRVVNGSLVI